jgi:hypothetical protein
LRFSDRPAAAEICHSAVDAPLRSPAGLKGSKLLLRRCQLRKA